jgi:hypothetical protein
MIIKVDEGIIDIDLFRGEIGRFIDDDFYLLRRMLYGAA